MGVLGVSLFWPPTTVVEKNLKFQDSDFLQYVRNDFLEGLAEQLSCGAMGAFACDASVDSMLHLALMVFSRIGSSSSKQRANLCPLSLKGAM